MMNRLNVARRVMRGFIYAALAWSEGCAGRHHQPPAIRAASGFKTKHRRRRAVKPRPDPPVACEMREVEVFPAARHLSGVIEQSHVQPQTTGNPAKLGRRQNAV